MLREHQNKYKARPKKSEDEILEDFNKFAASLAIFPVNTQQEKPAEPGASWKTHTLKFERDDKEIKTKVTPTQQNLY